GRAADAPPRPSAPPPFRRTPPHPHGTAAARVIRPASTHRPAPTVGQKSQRRHPPGFHPPHRAPTVGRKRRSRHPPPGSPPVTPSSPPRASSRAGINTANSPVMMVKSTSNCSAALSALTSPNLSLIRSPNFRRFTVSLSSTRKAMSPHHSRASLLTYMPASR